MTPLSRPQMAQNKVKDITTVTVTEASQVFGSPFAGAVVGAVDMWATAVLQAVVHMSTAQASFS
ncbi:MAG: hypothetical protein QXU75_06100 [Candidatus Methanomethylicaceae archaeon]